MGPSAQTLLFVDNEPDVLGLLKRTFENSFQVIAVSSGEKALEILRTRHVDLLITDQRMPEMLGSDLLARARSEGIDVTAILLTAYTDPEDIIAAINEGQVYRYVTKPWRTNELRLTVKNALEYTQLKRDKEKLLQQLHKRVEALSVLYDVTQQSAADAPTFDAIIDRVLAAVARVLPYDCGAALISLDEGRSASLKIRCASVVDERGLVWIKDTVLAIHRKSSSVLLPEDRVISRVSGTTSQDARAGAGFSSQLAVPLVTGGSTVGTLALFAQRPEVYSAEDQSLLDVLANQTTRAIQDLRAAQATSLTQMERMLESMGDGVLLTDEKNEIVLINPAARKLLHLSDDPAELTSRHLQEVLGFYPFELVRGWEFGGTQVLREEVKIYDRTIQSTVSAVVHQGILKGVVVVLRDITEQKQLDERKEEFVSIVSHELRTPLTSISGALDLVLNGIAGETNFKQQRYLAMAKESTDKLNAIVDDLLDLTKYSKGKLQMNLELTRLDELLASAIEKYGPPLLKKKIQLNQNIPAVPLRALVDPARLGQVLNNLLTNAVKFTPENGEIRIELGEHDDAPGYAALSVWNSGEPISEADSERIFEKFEQARSSQNRKVQGTGLGLAICRSIVEAHGGKIWTDPLEVGARFVVVVPVEPPVAQSAAVAEEGTAGPIRSSGALATILVVEDVPEIAFAIKAMLLAQGHRVFIAADADEALVLGRRHRPELILLDIRLPRIGGLELANIFRHDPETRHSSILAMSAADERDRALRQGAAAFLQKPIQLDKLCSAISGLIARKSQRREDRVLVVDDDEKIRAICREVLANLGFDVYTAGTLEEARTLVAEKHPDVLLLDVALPDGDGFLFIEELKAERASRHLSVIFISARSETSSKIRALKLGGDDYLTKPFDAMELAARIESVLRRKEHELGASPTTQLPGSLAIEREVMQRLSQRKPLAFCYLDLDNLKAFNDYYGFAKADGVIRQTGDLLREVVAQQGSPGDFLGHVAGDDFVLILDPINVDKICNQTVEAFDRIIPLYYDKLDRERGYIEAEDRFGQRRRFPIMSVSVVAVISDGLSTTHSELVRRAAEMKKRAKAIQGSVYLRSGDEKGSVRSA